MVHNNEETLVGDIEDLIPSNTIQLTASERYHNNSESVTWRPRKSIQKRDETQNENLCEEGKEKDEKEQEKENAEESMVRDEQQNSSYIPGKQKIYIKTWGCTHNNSDSEYMAGQLASYGFQLVEDKDSADLWILNSCTVKSPSEDTFRNDIELAKRTGKRVVLAGCVPQGAPKSDYLKDLSVIGVQLIDRVVEVVEETLKGNCVRFLQKKKDSTGRNVAGASLSLPQIRRNPLIEIIPINSGCLNQCTYCKTKHARGNLVSYTPEEIVLRASEAFADGCCEIWLTSEDTGAYGRDIGTSLPELLWRLVAIIPPHCMLRIGMTNPPYIIEHLEEMVKILEHPNVYAFLHIPVQSGSDTVLADMKREYNSTDFDHVVEYLRQHVPQITIATDIICGFPTETEEDFDETMIMCAKHQFPSLFINQFFPRPGTPAARMKRINSQVVKGRTKRLTELFNSYKPYAGREGEEYLVLVTEISHDRQHYVAHNKSYEQILLPKLPNLLGAMVKVRITRVTKFCMHAEVLDTDEENWYRHKASPDFVPLTTAELEKRVIALKKEKADKAMTYRLTQQERLVQHQRLMRRLLCMGVMVLVVQWMWRFFA